MSACASLAVMLKELRLATIGRHWAELASSDKARKWSHEQFLSALCELEITHRHTRRLAGYQKESKLPTGKTLPSFDFDQDEGINRAQIEALASNVDWVSQARNLLLFGASGLGKTHLACAIGARLIEQGVRVRYYPATALVQELQRARDAFCLESHLHKLDKYRLIILDDLGYVKRSDGETQVLFEFIAHRYETGSLIVTANQTFSDWDQIFADNMMTVAAIDRLVHHAIIIELHGQSYRKKTAMAQK
jgi:DNA replication protein DnaC